MQDQDTTASPEQDDPLVPFALSQAYSDGFVACRIDAIGSHLLIYRRYISTPAGWEPWLLVDTMGEAVADILHELWAYRPTDVAEFFGVGRAEIELLFPKAGLPGGYIPRALLWQTIVAGAGVDAQDAEQYLQAATALRARHLRRRGVPRRAVIERDGPYCRYCGKRVRGWDLVLDHVRPVSLQGETIPSNLVVACRKCNTKKGSEFFWHVGMTLLPLRGNPDAAPDVDEWPRSMGAFLTDEDIERLLSAAGLEAKK